MTVDETRAPEAPPEQPKKKHNWWVWISAALAVVAIGLLVWGATTQSDKNDLQAQLDQNQESGSAFVAAAKDLYDDVSEQLGATSEDLASTSDDLAATEDDLAKAEEEAAQAEKDATAAKEDAEQAESSTDKAQAQTDQARKEADQAQKEAEAAESKVAIAADCAKAYVGAFGALFEGESVQSQVAAVKEQLAGISATCQSALSGA